MALKRNKKEAHVLMVAFAAQAHINPMLRLGKTLVSKGLRVTFAATESARELILRTTIPAGINFEYFSDGLSLDYDRIANMDYFVDTIFQFGPTNLATLIQKLSQSGVGAEKFSCIINNPFVPWVAAVAADFGIPCATLWVQPCTLFALFYRFYNNLNPFPTINDPDMSVELPGMPLLHTEDLPDFVLPSNSIPIFPKLLTPFFRNMEKVTWVLTNSFYELEKDVIESMEEINPIRPVGPLVPPELLAKDKGSADLSKSDDPCIKWLDRQKPSSVIYISFGTLLDYSAKEIESIATALQTSQHPFLWVVKPPGETPLGFSEATRGQGLIVKWSPQTEVLGHPSVACFLSHCGWNSLSETVAAGVPVIAYPHWIDQPTNAKLVTDVLRVGVRIRKNQDGAITSAEVVNGIEEIMNGPRAEEFKKNAASWKQAARDAVEEGGSSDRNIQFFVDEIIGESSST